ncbi:MFS transporter [Pseudomonas putida]|uniref:Inner membrane transport protein YdhC n=1 Tax=Pseudomonas putida TaxID=303 RepID=A0A1Q9QZP5_PSEPU|nr:MFS transporter [Pseudomonas putida]OLS60631.1 Inner membrane transport protein YdhC [Pseudomonas putida]
MHHAVIAFLLLLTLLGAFPLDVILPSFPAISAHMAVDTAQVALSVSLFALMVTIAQLIVGPLSDQVGRRRLLLAGLALSIAGAIGCTLTADYPSFLAFRMLQALGCGCFVLSQALIQDLFSARQRNGLRILLTTASGLFISISPLLGSWLQSGFGWQASFVAFAMLAGLVWVMCLSMLPKDHRPMGIRTGLIEAYGPLLRDRSFLRLGALASVAFSCHFAFIVISPLMFMERLGLSPERFGEFFLLFGLAYLAAGLLAQRLDKYLRPLQQIGLGLVLIALAGAMLVFQWQELTPLRFLIPVIVGTTGTTLVRPAATSSALALHPDRAGTAAALLSTLVFAAGALASAAITLFSEQLPGSLGAGFLILAAAGALLLAPQFLHRRIGKEG